MHLDMLLNSALKAQELPLSMHYLHEASPRTTALAPLPSLNQHNYDFGRPIYQHGNFQNPSHQDEFKYGMPSNAVDNNSYHIRSPTRYLPSIHQSSFLARLNVAIENNAAPMYSEHVTTPSHWKQSHGREFALPSIHVKEEPQRCEQSSVINASAIQRRLAIERRNLKRNIVPRHHTSMIGSDGLRSIITDAKNTKNRESAAAYREKRDRRVKFIMAEILQIRAAHPLIEFKNWIPSKILKSERKPGESKEEYRRRTNRESAAGSREQQKEKLQYLTQELKRMRSLISPSK